jgi:hypothetical protein
VASDAVTGGLSRESSLLVECCRRRPDSGRILGLVDSVDWDVFTGMCSRNVVEPAVYLALKCHSDKVPPLVLERLERRLFQTSSRSMLFVEEAVKVLSSLAAARVDAALLKGLHLQLGYYAPDYLRPTSDVDVLVRSKDVAAAESVLKGLGYSFHDDSNRSREYWARFGHHYSYVNKEHTCVVDLHWHIFLGFSPVDLSEERLWGGARQVDYHGVCVFVLAPNILLAHVCLQFALSGFFHVTPLRYMCDIDRIVSKDSGRIDWAAFVDDCRRWGCQAFVYKALSMSSQALGTDVPSGVFEALREGSPRRHLVFVEKQTLERVLRKPTAHYGVSDFLWELYLSPGARRLMLLQRPVYGFYDSLINSVLSGYS